MNTHGFKLQKLKSLVIVSAIILAPAALFLLQNDTGSALGLFFICFGFVSRRTFRSCSFFWSLMIILFILSLVVSNLVLSLVLLGVVFIAFLLLILKFKQFLRIPIIFASSVLLHIYFKLDNWKRYNACEWLLALVQFSEHWLFLVYSFGKEFQITTLFHLYFWGL